MDKSQSANILVVDRDIHRRSLIALALEAEGNTVREVEDARAALAILARDRPDLIMIQLGLADMDGLSLARQIRNDRETRLLPVVLLTAMDAEECRLIARRLGIQALVGTPVNTPALKEQFNSLLHLNASDPQERLRLFQSAADSGPEDDLRRSYLETLDMLGVAMGMKNAALGGHLRNVGTLAGILSNRLGMGSKYGLAISRASTLHDIGQIGLPDEILDKPAPLDAQERTLIQSHCRQGAQILAQGRSPYLRMAAEIALSHHEHWDGSGYPHGLRGEAIPFSARIVAVCDVYDDLRSRRCYKPAMDHGQALRAMFAGDGRTRADHFDPLVLTAFHDAADDLQAVYAPSAEPVSEPVCA